MAQVILCDADGCGQSADVMVTNLNSGEVEAYCGGHYAELIFAMSSQMIENEASQAEDTEDDLPTQTDDNQEDNLEGKEQATDVQTEGNDSTES